GAHAAPDEPLDGTAVAERGPEVGGEHAHIGALAADDAKRSPRRGDLVNDDRTDDDLPRLAVDLDSLARQLVEPPPRVVDRRVHRRDLLDQADERAARLLEQVPRQPGARGGATGRVAMAAASDPRRDPLHVHVALAPEAHLHLAERLAQETRDADRRHRARLIHELFRLDELLWHGARRQSEPREPPVV